MEYKITQMVGDESCRYVLANGGHKPLVVIGVNPSTANESKSDQTMRKVMPMEAPDHCAIDPVSLKPISWKYRGRIGLT